MKMKESSNLFLKFRTNSNQVECETAEISEVFKIEDHHETWNIISVFIFMMGHDGIWNNA